MNNLDRLDKDELRWTVEEQEADSKSCESRIKLLEDNALVKSEIWLARGK